MVLLKKNGLKTWCSEFLFISLNYQNIKYDMCLNILTPLYFYGSFLLHDLLKLHPFKWGLIKCNEVFLNEEISFLSNMVWHMLGPRIKGIIAFFNFALSWK